MGFIFSYSGKFSLWVILHQGFCLCPSLSLAPLYLLESRQRARSLNGERGRARGMGTLCCPVSSACAELSPSPLSDTQQGLPSCVFYGPIMCEILPIREKLSTQNIDFKTDFLLQDYEEPLQSLQPEHFLKIQFVSHFQTHLVCFLPSVLGREGWRLPEF